MAKCCKCGQELTGTHVVSVPMESFADGIYPKCFTCVSEQFTYLVKATGGYRLALYAVCAALDIPFIPSAAKKEKTDGMILWSYLSALKGREEKRFADGDTVPVSQTEKKAEAAAAPMPVPDKEAQEKLEERIKRWGKKMPERKYEALEEKYAIEAHEFKGSITPRIEKNLITLSKLDVDLDEAIARSDFDMANRITDIIRKTREMESLRASDEKPSEEMRVDAMVSALEARGAMEDGTLVDRQTLLKLIGEARGHYEHSLDIVDAVLLASENARRRSDGERALTEVPDYLQIEDKKGELEKRMTAHEKEIMQRLGKIPPARAGADRKGGM